MAVVVRVLFLSYFGSLCYFAVGSFIDFQLATSDPNSLTLECVSSVTGDVDPEATIFFFSPNGDIDEPTGRVFSGGMFDITPMNEALLRCTSGNEESEVVAIAAVPTTSEDETTVHVFADVATELTCAILRGALADHLDPYTFSWESLNQQNFIVPVTPSPSSQYSNNNRTLTIFVDDSTRDSMYRCVLKLRRCNITRSDGSPRCQTMTYQGGLTRFAVLERSRVTTSPMNQEIHMNGVANFNCVGVGSFINISWQYTRISEDAVVVQKNVSENGTQIISTLVIDTSMINTTMSHSQSSVTVDIQCILRQHVPPEFNLQDRDDLIFSARLVITLDPDATPGTTTTGSPGSTSTTTTTSMGTTEFAIIWIVLIVVLPLTVIIIAVIIIFVLVRRRRGVKGSYSTTDSPPYINPTVPHKPTNRVYEELPESVFITAGTDPPPQCPFQRQNGIEYDLSNPKADNFSRHGSEDHYSRSGGGGSDLSGLSGVSGNIPGAHKMPTYSHDTSVVSEAQLLPHPSFLDKRYSDSTVNTRHTQSTIVPPTDHPYHHYRSATDVGYNGHAPAPGRYASFQGNMNTYDGVVKEIFMREQRYPPQQYPPQPYPEPPIPLPFLNHQGYASNVSHASSVVSKGSGSWHSSQPQQVISDMNLLTVMNCLMHNRDCEIVGCPCKQLQNRYQHLLAATVPLQQMKSPERRRSPERKHRKPKTLPVSSSTESDSDVPAPSSTRKAKLRLKLHDERKLHPHYHISTHSHHVGKTACNVVDNRRRSRSLSDLTPITEIRETPTPMVGGAIKAGTPIHCTRNLGEHDTFIRPTKEELLRHTAVTPLSKPIPPLLREMSLSENNIPVLCLNSCPLPPSPMKSKGKLGKLSQNNSSMQPLREVSNSTETDDSNTSSRSDSPTENEVAAKSSHSDIDEGIELVPQTSHQSSLRQDSSSFHAVRGSTSGYESEISNTVNTVGVASCLDPRGRVSPASRRSSSPFETATTVSSDGVVIETTEC